MDICTSVRSASDSLASSDSSSPFSRAAASFEFPASDNDEKLFQDEDDESDRWGRGCYRFGVWKNVKVCPRHPTPCLYSAQLCPPVQPANGDTEQLDNLAMCKSAQRWWWVQKCAKAVVQRRHVVHVLAIAMATLFHQALQCSQCEFSKRKTLGMCCVEYIFVLISIFCATFGTNFASIN